MGFQLVISEGKEAGREFVFDQASVLIGRTSECDVILYDPGVSRKHARIFSEGDGFFVEDMGSSNGTRVNGENIKKQALKDGDAISLGPVVFAFKPMDLEEGESTDVGGPEGGAHTRIVAVSELQRSRNKGIAGVPKNVGKDELEQMGKRGTQMIPAIKPKASAPRPPRASNPNGLQRKSNAGLAQREEDLPAGVEVAGGGRPRLARPSGERPALSAAEKARFKREGKVVGGAKLWWAQATKQQRLIAMIGAGVVGLAVLIGLVVAVLPEDTKPKPKEPTELTGEPITWSFGLGDGVTYERPDEKSFDFQVTSPVQVMVVLHYQSKDIGSKDEVVVQVNGEEVKWLPPDTLNSNEKTLEAIIPANVVKRNETNTVTFDNVKNPPESDPWRIWNVWVEVAVLPERDEAGLIADAEEKFKKGKLKWDQRDIGASNRWEAYKAFREAWLTLEAVPVATRPATSQLAFDKMNEARGELDLKCNQLLLEARTAYNLKQYDQARFALDHVNEFFPTKAHPCQNRAEAERYEYDL